VVEKTTGAKNLPVAAAKVVLSLAFLVFGANGFLHFLEMPPTTPKAEEFLGLLSSTGYLHVVKALEMIGGGLILGGRLAPLGLLILGPILVNIALYDLFFDPKGLPVVLVLSGLAIFIGVRHKAHFLPFFTVHPEHCTFKGK
jgi:putative oxidoreductase